MTPDTGTPLLDHFATLIRTPEDLARLNELILQLAVQGKLVPQHPDDEPASELLKRIRAEKKGLEKDGKLNPLPKVNKDEMPYELPKGWEWVRLANATFLNMGQSPPSTTYNSDGDGLPFYQGKKDFGDFFPTPTMWCTSPNKIAEKNDILISVRAPVGPTNICQETSCIGRGLAAIRNLAETNHLYLLYMFRAFEKEFSGKGFGTTFAAITKKDLENFFVPLPPLAEQKRIVARVEELLGMTRALEAQLIHATHDADRLHESALHHLLEAQSPDEFQAHWTFITDHFDLLYRDPAHLDALKQAILQLAVQGKLVPQDPTDETTSALLKRIQAEKTRLIKEGKIGKEQELPAITGEEKPFELPGGWEWVRFPEIGELARGKSKHRPRNAPFLFENGIYPFVQTGDVSRSTGRITTYSQMYSEQGLAQSRLWPVGTLCITIAANIAETGILGIEACFPDSVVGFIPNNKIGNPEYFQYFIQIAKERLEAYAPSTAQKNINLTILESLLIPLPPANEIKRIVAKVESLLSMCDALAEALMSAEAVRVKAVEAVVGGGGK